MYLATKLIRHLTSLPFNLKVLICNKCSPVKHLAECLHPTSPLYRPIVYSHVKPSPQFIRSHCIIIVHIAILLFSPDTPHIPHKNNISAG